MTLSSAADQNPARPVQSSIILLFLLGLVFFFFRNVITRCISSSSSSSTNEFQLPLQARPVSNGRKDSNESRPGQLDGFQPHSRRIIMISTAFAISLRLLFSTLILDNAQCSMPSIEVKKPSYCPSSVLTPTRFIYLCFLPSMTIGIFNAAGQSMTLHMTSMEDLLDISGQLFF